MKKEANKKTNKLLLMLMGSIVVLSIFTAILLIDWNKSIISKSDFNFAYKIIGSKPEMKIEHVYMVINASTFKPIEDAEITFKISCGIKSESSIESYFSKKSIIRTLKTNKEGIVRLAYDCYNDVHYASSTAEVNAKNYSRCVKEPKNYNKPDGIDVVFFLK